MTSEPIDPRDALVAAGRRRLLQHGIDALRSQLNAARLSADSSVARDTAYRAFRGDGSADSVTDAIVAAVARGAETLGQEGYQAALDDAIGAYHAGVIAGDDPEPNMKAALRAAFEAHLDAPGIPIGWTLSAAALPASAVWKGDRLAPEDVRLAEAILDSRRALYEAMTEQLMGLARVVMSNLGRRPSAEADLRSVLALTHALLDGALLRRVIEPEAMPPELFAEALYRLWMAFSEPGAYEDPRKPDDEATRRSFDALLEAAAELWRTRVDVSLADTAEAAAVPLDVAMRLFPGVGDLADSLVRARVAGGGFTNLSPNPGPTEARQHVVVLMGELQRLRDLADTIPHAVAASQAHRPTKTPPFAETLVETESRAIETLGLAPHARNLVEELVRFAAQGTAGWTAVIALLRTIGYHPDRVL